METNGCKYCIDEICINEDCPMRADYCPVPNDPEVCRYEDRPENGVTVEQEKFIRQIKAIKEYWIEEKGKSKEEVLDGFIFSLLVMIDGDNGINDFHALKIIDTTSGRRIDCGYLHEIYTMEVKNEKSK